MHSLFRQTGLWFSTVIMAGALAACGGGGSGAAAPAAPAVTISLSSSSINAGQSATLTWSAANATTCTASGPWSGTQNLNGSLAVSPTAGTNTYTLSCAGAGGSSSSSVTLIVNPPPVVALSVSPGSITMGQSATLTWSASNATSCTASGAWNGSQNLSGSLTVSPATGSNTYTLSCTGIGGNSSSSATLIVNPPPAVTISVSPASIAAGQSATLTWTSTNATSCSASGAWSGSQGLNGSQAVSPAAGNYTYTLNCAGAGGSSSSSATLVVGSPVAPAPVVAISVSPTSITAGQSATLTWTSADATSCSASGAWSGGQNLNGSQAVSPAAGSYTYTLNCTGAGGSSSSSATLIVNPPPVVVVSISPTSMNVGQSATLTWSSNNATSCSASGAWSGTQSLSGSLTVSPAAGSYTYTLSCTGAGGSSSGSATLMVNPPPVVIVSVSPTSIIVGQSATLTWSTNNATTCTASGSWGGTQTLGGSLTVSPAAGSNTYTLNCTGVGGSSSSSAIVTVYATTTGYVSVLAGMLGGAGNLDGTGAAARFTGPAGVAVDSAGNFYVADNYAIRKITPAGVVTTFAGSAVASGSADGTGTTARFSGVNGVTIDSADNLYVSDSGATIRKITPAGVVTTIAGTAGVQGSTDGTGGAARFFYPSGVAADSSGNVYVADYGNNTIRKITPAGVVTTFAGTAGAAGSTDATGSAARFNGPTGIAIDSSGNVYVADSRNYTIRKITPAGLALRFAGTTGVAGSADGNTGTARFYGPKGVTIDSTSNVYVSDGPTIRKITPALAVTTVVGTAGVIGSADGTGGAASFYCPGGITTDSAGNVYVGDPCNNNFRKVTPARGVTTIAGSAGFPGSADGSGTAARFNGPTGVTTDSAGNLYVANPGNSSVRKITSAGVVTTLASGAGIYSPSGVATDSAGNFYVANTGNYTISKITPAGMVSTLAGTAGVCGSADTFGGTPRFCGPTGVATDSADNVYVADTNNNTIRKMASWGAVATLAGKAGVAEGAIDATGDEARFFRPQGVATDSAGNVYVADTGNNTIRKVTPAGVVTTIAGSAGFSGSADGTGTAARFNGPTGVATDSAGNVYVADAGNYTIRKITPAGVVTTVAGVVGQAGVVPGPLPTSLNSMGGITIDASGALFITTENSVIKIILP